jgi:hypothetical protein
MTLVPQYGHNIASAGISRPQELQCLFTFGGAGLNGCDDWFWSVCEGWETTRRSDLNRTAINRTMNAINAINIPIQPVVSISNSPLPTVIPNTMSDVPSAINPTPMINSPIFLRTPMNQNHYCCILYVFKISHRRTAQGCP